MRSNKYIAAYRARNAPDAVDPDPHPAALGSQEPAAAVVTDEDAAGAASELVTHDEPARSSEPAAEQVTRVEFTRSSNLRAATLDPTSRIVTVDFANGTTYRYANFTSELMSDWQAAKSAGGWFHQNVRSKPDRHPVVDSSTVVGG